MIGRNHVKRHNDLERNDGGRGSWKEGHVAPMRRWTWNTEDNLCMREHEVGE